jgi:hypothetical protein
MVVLCGLERAPLRAQGVQVFELEYELCPASAFQDADGSERVRLEGFEATLSLPVVLSKDKAYLLNKLKYERLHVRYQDLDPGAAPDRINLVHGLKYEGTFSAELRPRWWVSTVASLELASDFKDVSAGDLQLQGAAVLTKNLREDLVLGGGLGLINSSGEAQLVPVLYLRHATQRLRTELIFPEAATFHWSAGRTLRLGLEARYSGNRYRLDRDLEARASVITAGPSMQWRFMPALSLSLKAGATLLRRFDGFLDPAREDLPDHLRTGLFVKTGLQVWAGGGRDQES